MAQASAASVQAVPSRPLAERPEAQGLAPGGAPFAGLMAHFLKAPPTSGTPAHPKEASDQDTQPTAEPDASLACAAAGVTPTLVAPSQEIVSPNSAPAAGSLEALEGLTQPSPMTPPGATSLETSATPQPQAGAKPSQAAALATQPELVPSDSLTVAVVSPATYTTQTPSEAAPGAAKAQTTPTFQTQGKATINPAIPAQSTQSMVQVEDVPVCGPSGLPTPEGKAQTAPVPAQPLVAATTEALLQSQAENPGAPQAKSLQAAIQSPASLEGPARTQAGTPTGPRSSALSLGLTTPPEAASPALPAGADSVRFAPQSPSVQMADAALTAPQVKADTAAAATALGLEATPSKALEPAPAAVPSTPLQPTVPAAATFQAKPEAAVVPTQQNLPLTPFAPPETGVTAFESAVLQSPSTEAAPVVATFLRKADIAPGLPTPALPFAPSEPPKTGVTMPQSPNLQPPSPVALPAGVTTQVKADAVTRLMPPSLPVPPSAQIDPGTAAIQARPDTRPQEPSLPLGQGPSPSPTLPSAAPTEPGHPTPQPTLQALLAESAFRLQKPASPERPGVPAAAPVAEAAPAKTSLPQAPEAPAVAPGPVTTPARVSTQAAPTLVPQEVTTGAARGPLQPALAAAGSTPEVDAVATKPAPAQATFHLHAQDGSSMVGQTAVSRATEAIPVAPQVPTTATAPPPSAQVLQMEGGLRWMLKGGAQEAQLQLHPEALGQVTIHLKVEGGEVHARIWVTEAASVQAVREGRPHLELSLKEQGLHLGSFDLQQGRRPHQEVPAPPTFSERIAPEGLSARQEAPAPVAPAILNPHHVELYA